MKKITGTGVLLCFLMLEVFAQNGLKAEYYDGTNFNRLVGTQTEAKIDYYWDNYPPFAGMNPNKCSVRWTGRLLSPKTGEVTFKATVDDGIRVWVGGVQVINNWQLNDYGQSEGKVKLEKGKYYDLKVEYFNALLEAEIKLFWVLSDTENLSWYERLWYEEDIQIIPAEYYFQPIVQGLAETAEEEEPVTEKVPQIKSKKQSAPAPPIPPAKVEKPVIEDYIPKNVQFAQAKAEILPESFAELDRLAAYLVKNPRYKIKIEGHTDNVGDAQKNLELSLRRARATAAYLIKKGVDNERLSAEGFGGSRPLSDNDGRKYHPENRRVEFIVE